MENFKITDFFQRGTAVKTQIQNSIDWIPNVVFDTYSGKNEVGIIFDDRYKNFVILEKDIIKLNYAVGKVQYFMEAYVTGIKLEAVRIMTLKIVSIKKIPNLRKDERYSVNYGANISSLRDTERNFVVITNISLSGLAFISRKTFFVSDVVNVSILLPAGSFYISAEIVRCNETVKGTEYGVKFVRQDDEAREELRSLIEDIKEREDRLSRIVGIGGRAI